MPPRLALDMKFAASLLDASSSGVHPDPPPSELGELRRSGEPGEEAERERLLFVRRFDDVTRDEAEFEGPRSEALAIHPSPIIL